jgi:hypothetical protein
METVILRPELDTLFRLIRVFEQAKLAYALMGLVAVELHGARPYTSRTEVLLNRPGFDIFCGLVPAAGFVPIEGRPRRFVDSSNGEDFELFLSGHHPGRFRPTLIPFPDPRKASEVRDNIRVLTLSWLIQLKLAAKTHRDAADVVGRR